MLISWNWLKQYVALDMPLAELEQRLMMAGLNHEGTEKIDGDIVVDLEVTSNRPDCLGHIGVAREVAVLWNQQLERPAAAPAVGETPVWQLAKVTVRCPDLCPRYTARVIQGVKIGESPAWLRDRLGAVGVAAVNNVVDITNYVLMECGQPLHAFDLARLRGAEIIVREAKPGEPFQAINHNDYKLEKGICVIADAQRPVALGGVMGGADSEVSAATCDLLIEAAEFSPVSIRNTARKLNLHSPSSYRFERGLDPQGVDWASRRCCELILDLAGGDLAQGVIDIAAPREPRGPVVLRLAQLKRILGIDVDPEEVARILVALGNEKLRADATEIEVAPPSWRRDLTREIDLIEEVARIHGYDKIPENVSVPMFASLRSDSDRVMAKLRHVMTAAGFNEAMTLSGAPESWADVFTAWCDQPPLRVQTPIIRGANVMRTSLLPSLLAARRTNETLSNPDIELFEIANTYLTSADAAPTEERMLAMTSGGDFFHVKGVVEALLAELQIEAELEARDTKQPLLDVRSAELWLDGKLLGYVGQVRPESAEPFELRGATTVAELNCSVLMNQARLIPRYRKPPEFPSMARDVNLVVDEQVRWSQIAGAARAGGGELLESLKFQETYRSPKLAEAGKKKVLFAVSFRSPQRTLTADETNAFHQQIVAACQEKFGAELG